MRQQSEQPDRSLPIWALLILVMVLVGMAMPIQSRVNTALAAEIGSATLAATISFLTGLLVMIVVTTTTSTGRRAVRRVRPALRSGQVRWWYLLAGCVGAYFVLTQTLTVGFIGVAVFSVAVITGQTVGGLLWDRIGLGPAGRKMISPFRVLGAILTLVAVAWTVSPHLTAAGRGVDWLILVLLPAAAGFLNSGQQALNGRQAAAYGPVPTTLINFLTGSTVLLAVWGIQAVATGIGPALSPVWWHYLGGPLGIVFIGAGAVLVAKVGVLVTAMGMIAGQLVGSLVLEVVVPTAGSIVAFATVAGTGLTLVAVVLASLPDIRRSRAQP
ncbi:DMT family transporter [Bogoriella caseilytica]|uniref:Transporter family-2 protein n=1 Tax=Bogoriella caseilytica TaxID=56055 RepID=A0A3N2BE13_9MICO|nr:DMT family transporter [Bogoriella caseilytica]ROR73274.1 transporter family-2 protein [Bogoriella caseilytica]